VLDRVFDRDFAANSDDVVAGIDSAGCNVLPLELGLDALKAATWRFVRRQRVNNGDVRLLALREMER